MQLTQHRPRWPRLFPARSKSKWCGLLLCLWAGLCPADDRLWVPAQINGRPARLIFDTGADRLILFGSGAQRLGLPLSEAPADLNPPSGAVALGTTAACDVSFWQNSWNAPVAVFEMPAFLDMQADGVLGWGAVRQTILHIDAGASTIERLQVVPDQAWQWSTFALGKESDYLSLEIPNQGGSNGLVFLDSGFVGGVALPPERWHSWKLAHPDEPTTMTSYFMPGAGLVVKEEVWADSISFGPLVLTDVPVTEANPAQVALGSSGYVGSLGLAALKRLDLIIDGKRGSAHLKLKTNSPAPYEHNRLGAVFVPVDSRSDSLVARLAKGGPADVAGICDGDILLKIGKLDATKWRSDPAVLPLSQFWSQPPGTKLDLTLRRQSETFRTTVMLRQILGHGLNPPRPLNQNS